MFWKFVTTPVARLVVAVFAVLATFSQVAWLVMLTLFKLVCAAMSTCDMLAPTTPGISPVCVLAALLIALNWVFAFAESASNWAFELRVIALKLAFTFSAAIAVFVVAAVFTAAIFMFALFDICINCISEFITIPVILVNAPIEPIPVSDIIELEILIKCAIALASKFANDAPIPSSEADALALDCAILLAAPSAAAAVPSPLSWALFLT